MSHDPAVLREFHTSGRFSRRAGSASCGAVALAGALLLAVGCAHRPPLPEPRPVQHVVVCWLKHPGDAHDREALLATCAPLRAIPGLLAIHAGTAVPSERPVVDDTFDVALVMTFADTTAMQAYITHPAHQQILRDVVAPLANKVVIYDIVAAPADTLP